MKIIARIVSYIFHPLLFPTYGAVFILMANPHRFGMFGSRMHIAWLIITFALTFIFPVIWLLMMKQLNMIESIRLETSRERIIPFVATATFYLWTVWMFKPAANMKIPPNELLFYMMSGATLSLFLAFIINIFSKVSLHTLGAGNMIGLALTMIRYSSYDLRFIFIGIILIAGVIGAARLILDSHEEREVMAGYLAGFTSQFIAFSLMPRFL